MSLSMTGALLGGVAGGGLLCAIAYAPPLRRPSLEDRVAPYLRDGRSTSRLLADPATPQGPFAPVEALAPPFLTDAAQRLDRILGGTAALRRRPQRTGGSMTVKQLRLQQLLFAASQEGTRKGLLAE
jgi:tight adherence protein C